MKYSELMATLDHCPFCDMQQRVLLENEHAYLTYALAPYHPDHLLVVPKAHIEHVLDISEDTLRDINRLEKDGLRLLNRLGYDNVSLLVREGAGSGKSISHLHYHIIPNIVLSNMAQSGKERPVLTKEEESALITRLTALL